MGQEASYRISPLWVVLSAHGAIALGTLSGGWRIVHTMGSKITKLKPVGGFCAETAGATALFAATLAGIPVSLLTRLLAQSWAWEQQDDFPQLNGESLGYRVGMGINNPDGWRIRGTLLLCH